MKFIFDIDDTILISTIEKDGSYKMIGENLKLIIKLNRLYDNGHQIILWTGRHWNHLATTQKQLFSAGVKYHTLVMGKPVVDFYVDDKAIRPDEFLKLEI